MSVEHLRAMIRERIELLAERSHFEYPLGRPGDSPEFVQGRLMQIDDEVEFLMSLLREE